MMKRFDHEFRLRSFKQMDELIDEYVKEYPYLWRTKAEFIRSAINNFLMVHLPKNPPPKIVITQGSEREVVEE